MKLTYKEYLFIAILAAFLVMVVLWSCQKHRADSLANEQTLNQNLQKQEKVIRTYIPMKLEEKNSDELTIIGVNLWGE
jgi:hypothetical protein